MSDAAFIKHAKASWQRVLEMQDAPSSVDALAIAVALWATMNADKLIEIAERKL